MPTFVLNGVEHVYDAFDEYEHPNPMALKADFSGLGEAISAGESFMQAKIDEDRKLFKTSGSFYASLISIENTDGRTLFMDMGQIQKLVRIYGGRTEDYRSDGDFPQVFISYSHGDEEFAVTFVEKLNKYPLRSWFDRENELHFGYILHRAGNTEKLDSETEGYLRQAVFSSRGIIVILSPASVRSRWVQLEIEEFFRNRIENTVCAFVYIENGGLNAPEWLQQLVGKRRVYDFSGWKNPEVFDEKIKSLLRETFKYSIR
jgi:hypothetical protein